MFAYKVVKNVNGLYLSSTLDYSQDLRVEYQIEKIAKSKIGKLFVFDSLVNATNFIYFSALYDDPTFSILLVEIPDKNYRLKTIPDSRFNSPYDMALFWLEPKDNYPEPDYTKCPYGTLLVDWVKPIRKLSFREIFDDLLVDQEWIGGV